MTAEEWADKHGYREDMGFEWTRVEVLKAYEAGRGNMEEIKKLAKEIGEYSMTNDPATNELINLILEGE